MNGPHPRPLSPSLTVHPDDQGRGDEGTPSSVVPLLLLGGSWFSLQWEGS